MSHQSTSTCDHCGKSVNGDDARGRWYKVDASRSWPLFIESKPAPRVDVSFDACSLVCAAPLLVKLFEAMAADAAGLAKRTKETDPAEIEAARVEGLRLFGDALSSMFVGEAGR